MVAILEKTEHNTDFHQIVDFLEASHIRYALTVRPTVYVSHIRQFWSTARVKITNGKTKDLAKVNGRKGTVSESSIRRHLKLNDEEELFASMLVPQGEGLEYPSKPHHTPSDQDEPIHHEQITQSSQHVQITSHEPIPQSHEQTTSQELTIPSQSHSIITTSRRITRGSIRISQSKVPSPGADETAFPTRDARYGEAFPNVTRLDARQDRENIAKTSAMPHEALPRVTSLGGGKGSMQQKLQELMDIYTSLQGQHSLMEERVQSQDLEITQLKNRVKTFEDNERRREGFSQEDAPNTEGWIKGRIYEMANVLATLGAVNILASRGLRLVFTTASLSVATASTGVSSAVATAGGSFPTAIARIHAERELKMMIAELDRSNEMVAKYLSEYEQAEARLSHDEKVELIDELLIYQSHLDQIMKYQAQQNKPAIKTERRNFYMSILRSHAGWKAKDFKGMTFVQIEEKFIPSEEPKELSEEELKKMMELVPVEELYIEALQGTSDLYASGERLSIDKRTHNFDAV
nr:hypothetical protein [Tanacetum cinerariifolium]